jgi:hypothetical protein
MSARKKVVLNADHNLCSSVQPESPPRQRSPQVGRKVELGYPKYHRDRKHFELKKDGGRKERCQ